MSNTKIKYLVGWIKSENLQRRGWLSYWNHIAVEAEKEDCELVVFKIPKQNLGKMKSYIEEIEIFLQKKTNKIKLNKHE